MLTYNLYEIPVLDVVFEYQKSEMGLRFSVNFTCCTVLKWQEYNFLNLYPFLELYFWKLQHETLKIASNNFLPLPNSKLLLFNCCAMIISLSIKHNYHSTHSSIPHLNFLCSLKVLSKIPVPPQTSVPYCITEAAQRDKLSQF